jgi:hypothetical protein
VWEKSEADLRFDENFLELDKKRN